MLRKKTLRELKQNFGQFFSLFILVLLAAMLYAGFMADPIGGGRAREAFHRESNLASAWLYGEGFTQDNLDAVRSLPYVDSAQLRMQVTGSAPDCGGAEIDIYLEKENIVNKPQKVSGEEFDPGDTDGLWLNRNFADAWDISVGDMFQVEYNGIQIEKKVKGIILSPEYEYMCASTDADTNFKNIGYVFMSYDAFPVKDYVVHLIENESNLSFHERIAEFATLKVLGFSSKKIRGLLTRQNFWLSVIGILAGMPFGKTMLEAMMNSNGENFDYVATVMPSDYMLSAACVLLISMAVSFLFTKKIRILDMVGTLKGAE